MNYPDSQSICIHFKSIEHKQIPLKKNIIRAEVIIGGYYLKTISIDPPRTLIITIDEFDYKVWNIFTLGKCA